jgi:hypothetical protein
MKRLIFGVVALFFLLAAVPADAGDRDSPKAVVTAYWEAQMQDDFEKAWEVVSDQSKAEITKEQFIARQQEIAEKKLYTIDQVIIGEMKELPGYTVVYLTIKMKTPSGEQENRTSDRIVNEDGRWGLVLSKKFIGSAKRH